MIAHCTFLKPAVLESASQLEVAPPDATLVELG